jgi:hypothetical protein
MKHIIAVVLIFLTATAAMAWNSTGHKAIAIIAYQQLTPPSRKRVDALLAQHPEYPQWTAGVAKEQRGRAAFLAASVWPDKIRNDPRFHDDNRRITSDIAGLQHSCDHTGSADDVLIALYTSPDRRCASAAAYNGYVQ